MKNSGWLYDFRKIIEEIKMKEKDVNIDDDLEDIFKNLDINNNNSVKKTQLLDKINEVINFKKQFVNRIEKRHFSEAMKNARRSVSDQDIRRYELFSQKNNSQTLNNFRFPTETEEQNTEEDYDESLYD